MTKTWVQTYYVATRFGSMQERTRQLPKDLTPADAQRLATKFIWSLQQRGQPVHPQFDLQLENVA